MAKKLRTYNEPQPRLSGPHKKNVYSFGVVPASVEKPSASIRPSISFPKNYFDLLGYFNLYEIEIYPVVFTLFEKIWRTVMTHMAYENYGSELVLSL